MKKLFLCVLLFAAGCATVDVSTDYDRDVKFENLKTYAWVPGWTPRINDPRLDSTLLDTRVRNAVESTLRSKGYQKAGSDKADFWVSYQAAINEKLDVNTIDLP